MSQQQKKRLIRQRYKYLDRIEYILWSVERDLNARYGDPKLKGADKVSTC